MGRQSLPLATVILLALCLLSPLTITARPDPPPQDPPSLRVEGKIKTVVEAVPFQVIAPPGATLIDWSYPDGVKATEDGEKLTVTTCPKGPVTFRARLTVIDFEKKSVARKSMSIEIVFGGIDPPAPPGPGPKPPEPPLPPTPTGPLTVLIVFESKDLPTMPASQRDGIIRSLKFQKMLTDRTDKMGPNRRGWNIWDKDQKGVELMDQFWQDAFRRPRPTLPYVHLFRGGKVAFEGPLPATAEEAENLITKYTGN